MKTILLTALKLGIVLGLIYWLVTSGRLDFKQLEVAITTPAILVSAVLLWTVFYLLLGAVRWWLLLRGLGIDLSYLRTLRLHLIGFFFNTAMPGAVGGDIIKAIYVIREQQSARKTPAMLTILLDRVIGLSALFVMASTAVVFELEFFLANKSMLPLAIFAVTGLLGFAVGLAYVMLVHADKDPVRRLFAAKFPGSGLLSGIYDALRSYRSRPGVIFAALGLSCIIQIAALCFALLLTETFTGIRPDIGVFATIFPLGVMTTALPLAPGGLGVGHVAFDRLFAMAGLSGGANVFNVMVLTQLTMNLTGIVPYLLHRTKLPPVEEMKKELAS